MNENGVCIVTVKAGATPPLLHSTMGVDTRKYSKMKFEMKIPKGIKVGAGRAVLRHTIWKGDDILFQPIADGQWHEYVIDCAKVRCMVSVVINGSHRPCPPGSGKRRNQNSSENDPLEQIKKQSDAASVLNAERSKPKPRSSLKAESLLPPVFFICN